MPRRGSAKRFAQAIFEIGREGDDLEQWSHDLRRISLALKNEEFRLLLEHSKVPISQKLRTIEDSLPLLQPLARNMLGVLTSRGLVDLAELVEFEFIRLLDVHQGRVRGNVVSAVELYSEEKERLVRFLANLEGKEIALDTSIDSSLIGGLLVRVGDKLIDGSTRYKLEKMRSQLDSRLSGK